MTKKNKKTNNNMVEKGAALGFMIGSVVWFLIYFTKEDLAFDKLLLYMFIGLFVGGLLGELVKYFINKKSED